MSSSKYADCVFPAYAGVIPDFISCVAFGKCVPRVCGGDPKPYVNHIDGNKCSPRMRG